MAGNVPVILYFNFVCGLWVYRATTTFTSRSRKLLFCYASNENIGLFCGWPVRYHYDHWIVDNLMSRVDLRRPHSTGMDYHEHTSESSRAVWTGYRTTAIRKQRDWLLDVFKSNALTRTGCLNDRSLFCQSETAAAVNACPTDSTAAECIYLAGTTNSTTLVAAQLVAMNGHKIQNS